MIDTDNNSVVATIETGKGAWRMAYHQNRAAFAKAVQGQTARANSVNVEFARAAVTEMRRSFDQMKFSFPRGKIGERYGDFERYIR